MSVVPAINASTPLRARAAALPGSKPICRSMVRVATPWANAQTFERVVIGSRRRPASHSRTAASSH
jgi:hypothetical protein